MIHWQTNISTAPPGVLLVYFNGVIVQGELSRGKWYFHDPRIEDGMLPLHGVPQAWAHANPPTWIQTHKAS